jgi:hypothetical protein
LGEPLLEALREALGEAGLRRSLLRGMPAAQQQQQARR